MSRYFRWYPVVSYLRSFMSSRFVSKCSRFVPKFESFRTQTPDRFIHLFEIPNAPAREQMLIVANDK